MRRQWAAESIASAHSFRIASDPAEEASFSNRRVREDAYYLADSSASFKTWLP